MAQDKKISSRLDVYSTKASFHTSKGRFTVVVTGQNGKATTSQVTMEFDEWTLVGMLQTIRGAVAAKKRYDDDVNDRLAEAYDLHEQRKA